MCMQQKTSKWTIKQTRCVWYFPHKSRLYSAMGLTLSSMVPGKNLTYTRNEHALQQSLINAANLHSFSLSGAYKGRFYPTNILGGGKRPWQCWGVKSLWQQLTAYYILGNLLTFTNNVRSSFKICLELFCLTSAYQRHKSYQQHKLRVSISI